MLLAQLRQSPRCVDSPAVVGFVQTVVSLLDSSPYALSVVRRLSRIRTPFPVRSRR